MCMCMYMCMYMYMYMHVCMYVYVYVYNAYIYICILFCLCASAHREERWKRSKDATIVSGYDPTILSQMLSQTRSLILSQLRSQHARPRLARALSHTQGARVKLVSCCYGQSGQGPKFAHVVTCQSGSWAKTGTGLLKCQSGQWSWFACERVPKKGNPATYHKESTHARTKSA